MCGGEGDDTVAWEGLSLLCVLCGAPTQSSRAGSTRAPPLRPLPTRAEGPSAPQPHASSARTCGARSKRTPVARRPPAHRGRELRGVEDIGEGRADAGLGLQVCAGEARGGGDRGGRESGALLQGGGRGKAANNKYCRLARSRYIPRAIPHAHAARPSPRTHTRRCPSWG